MNLSEGWTVVFSIEVVTEGLRQKRMNEDEISWTSKPFLGRRLTSKTFETLARSNESLNRSAILNDH
jgi:hypothetical protein